MELPLAKLDPQNALPVYLQICRQFKLLILRRVLDDGDELPSRRILAAHWGVNPNTMQKAFAEMEKEGLLETPPNAKSILRVSETTRERLRAELLHRQIAELIVTARDIGVDYKQLTDLISAGWEPSSDM